MKVFVTGSAGLLGSRLIERLAGDHEIVALDRVDPPDSMPTSVHYVQADLRDADRVRETSADCEVVVHLGAIPGPLRYVPQTELFEINVQGTFNVLHAAKRNKPKIVILASSLCAIGFPKAFDNHGLAYLPVDEDHPCRPCDVYDLTKLLNEQSAAMLTRTTGIPTICLRLPALVDVKKSAWFPDEVHKQNPRLLLGDYLDLADAARVIELALDRTDLTHEVMFVNAETFGHSQAVPEYIKRFQPAVEWRGDPPGETTPLINCAKVKRVLGFTPAVTWQQGMAS